MDLIKRKWEPIDFVFYASFVKWPVLGAIVVEIGVRLVFANYYSDLPANRVDLFMWIIRLAAFIFIGWRVGKTYGQVPPLGALAGAISGATIGLVIALFRFHTGWLVWKVFNVITETTLSAVVGCLVVFLIIYLWDLWPRRKKRGAGISEQ